MSNPSCGALSRASYERTGVKETPEWKRRGTSSLERKIDKIVYELYGLGQRDIVLIDNSVPSRRPLN